MMYEGLIALLWCLLWWWWFVEDSPDQDRSITDQELEYLQNTIGVCFLNPFSVGSLTMLGGGGNGNAVNFIFHLQISGYLADTFRADGKLSTTHIRKLFTCGAYLGQVISELESCP